MARASKGRNISLPRTVNFSTGKESKRQTGFTDVAWGKPTCAYASSARSLAVDKFKTIIEEAKEFLKPIRSRNKTTMEALDIIEIDDNNNEWAHLINNLDSD